MICVLALLVFGTLGVFSASHRRVALEAWECVTSRVKREPCETGLDERLEASIVGKTLEYSPRIAKTLKKNFEVFSWILVILVLVSGLVAGFSIYNWVVYGNCNGPDSNQPCGFNQFENMSNKTISPGEIENATETTLGNSTFREPCEGVKV